MSDVPSQPLKHPDAISEEAVPDDERVTDYYLWRRKAAGPRFHRGTGRGLDRAPDFAPRCTARNGAPEWGLTQDDLTSGITSISRPGSRRRILTASFLAALLAAAAFFIVRN